MEDTGKQKFEENWLEAVGSANVAPPEKVWTSIEQQLGNDSMKRRVVFYQRLAAASILFAFLAGAFGLYWRDQRNTQLAEVKNSQIKNQDKEKKSSNSKSVLKNEIPKTGSSRTESSKTEKAAGESKVLSKGHVASNDSKLAHANSQKIITSKNNDDGVISESKEILTEQKNLRQALSTNEIAAHVNQDIEQEAKLNREGFYGSVSQQIESAPLYEINLKGEPQNVELVRKLPAMPAAFLNRENEKKYDEKWWAAAGASAGSYNPNYSNSSFVAQSSAYNTAALSLSPSSVPANYGTSYSVALTAAHRVSKRWVVQSGMQYLARSIDYTSNYTNYSGNKAVASVADYASLNTSQVTVSSPYQLESRSEYISIPLQAGYVLVDRKFSLLLNSGISSDIFIRNTLTDLSGQRSSYSESGGQNSPYRTFMWSALASTELSYKMGTHYRLALVPGMRYSLSQVMKSDQATQGNPMIWDIGFRFRYIFK